MTDMTTVNDLDRDAYSLDELGDDLWCSCDRCCEPCRTDEDGEALDQDSLCLLCRQLIDDAADAEAELEELLEAVSVARARVEAANAKLEAL